MFGGKFYTVRSVGRTVERDTLAATATPDHHCRDGYYYIFQTLLHIVRLLVFKVLYWRISLNYSSTHFLIFDGDLLIGINEQTISLVTGLLDRSVIGFRLSL